MLTPEGIMWHNDNLQVGEIGADYVIIKGGDYFESG